jgi:DNA-directed RNA polymerase specialized sigma24 family protein
VRLGRYELHSADDLCKLLAVMARNQVISLSRRADVRLRQEWQPPDGDGDESPSPEEGPGRRAEARALFEQVCRRLTEEERWLAEQRLQGRPWADIAAERCASAEALRKKHDRALERVAQEFGLD